VLGERLAEEHLTAAGYAVLKRNFRTRYGELDLIAASAGALVFCEVKTRVNGTVAGPSHPLEAIGPDKRRRLRLMAGPMARQQAGVRAALAALAALRRDRHHGHARGPRDQARAPGERVLTGASRAKRGGAQLMRR
jgi:Holliday junction resolvase-like predicted endonuclease